MVLEAKEVINLIKKNMDERDLPLPLDKEIIYSWSKGIKLPEKGEYLLYTGGLYQLLPYIESLVSQLERLERSGVGGLVFKLAGRSMKLMDLAKLITKPEKEVEKFSHDVLRSIVKLLRVAKIDFYYDPALDGYSGVLLYDMGLIKSFRKYAERVVRKLASQGVRKIITVDPHTTHMIRSVYPSMVNSDFIVKSYLELLAENVDKLHFKEGEAEAVVIHDPCLYARFEDVTDQPRTLLKAAGYKVIEPRRSKKLTYCCGGPIESLAPSLSKKIAQKRIEELEKYGNTIATLCPICYANLHRVASKGTRVIDISMLLSRRVEGA